MRRLKSSLLKNLERFHLSCAIPVRQRCSVIPRCPSRTGDFRVRCAPACRAGGIWRASFCLFLTARLRRSKKVKNSIISTHDNSQFLDNLSARSSRNTRNRRTVKLCRCCGRRLANEHSELFLGAVWCYYFLSAPPGNIWLLQGRRRSTTLFSHVPRAPCNFLMMRNSLLFRLDA